MIVEQEINGVDIGRIGLKIGVDSQALGEALFITPSDPVGRS